MNQTIRKIENILTSQYDIGNYTDFIREIFPSVRIIAPDKFRKEFSNFSYHIEGSAHVGNYVDPDGKTMIIHAVQLKKASQVENSRSTQRSYAKKLMEAGNADAAIIAFYTEGDPKWRISFVRLDYEIKFESGKLKTTENLTPARRYSYLVGQDEPCHTAISRFRRFIVDDPNAAQPTLDDLEEAFSVEKVTEEFFRLYCEKFHQLRESLEANPDFVIEAEQRNFTSAQFAKKLMGQIVFLYFLQKKGWLGVKAWPREMTEKEYKKAYYAQGRKSRELIPKVYTCIAEDQYILNGKALNALSDEDETILATSVKGNPWGTGSRTFMRTLFEFSQKKNANFFDDYLEPLFYDALNVNRGEQGYDPALHCRIPFLSGGLFEPIDGYDWEHNDFAIPNEVFSNREEKGERDADGILDIFDRYNFTISEDEPMEREVAIDPEMLGKVFENLLEIQDRKSKGAFYTPREIVHYMCQETLISYLVKKTGLKEQDIRDFILLGDFLKDEDTAKDKRQGNNDMLISEEIYKIDRNGNVVVNRLKEIDDALANIRVADPAVGSGAFPLGMLNEIVRARQNISAYMAITMDAYQTRMMYNNDRSPYNLKLMTIKNCIFAADIEPSAVDIAQLRLWLSLVIDDEINPNANNPLDGHKNPIPLPNLECNIVCGNSLIDEFEGIKLINFNDTIGTGGSNQQQNMFQNAFDFILPSLLDAQEALFRCDDTTKKQELKERIEALKDEIVKSQMPMDNTGKWKRYQAAKRTASKPFVLWQIDFARVFSEKGGFDIVIGNPPYIGESGHKEIFREISATEFGKRFYQGKMDFFYFFFHKGIDLSVPSGEVALITTNYYPTATGAKKLRVDFKNRSLIRKLINFNEIKVFESALGQHNMITFLTKKTDYENRHIICKTISCNGSYVATSNQINKILNGEDESTSISFVEQNNLYDGKEAYIRFQGVVSSGDDAIGSVINKMAQQKKHLKDFAEVNQGVVSGCDYVSKRNISDIIDESVILKDGIFVLDMQNTRDRKVYDSLTDNEKHITRPFFKNSEIQRYYCNTNNTKFLFYLSKDVEDIHEYPNIEHHLSKYMPILMRRREAKKGVIQWFHLQWGRSEHIFTGEKIVVPYRTKTNAFAYNDGDWFCRSDAYVITKKDSDTDLFYLLAILNSKITYIWLYNRGKRKGRILELFQVPLSEIPIIELVPAEAEELSKLARKITEKKMFDKTADTTLEESSIDRILFNAYSFSENEVSAIETFDVGKE